MSAATPRPRCACCGKPYGRRDTTTDSFVVPIGQPLPPPRNMPLVAETMVPPMPAGGAEDTPREFTFERGNRYERSLVTVISDRRVTRVYWDGETYVTPYRPFCTLRCALAFAECAHRNGFRVEGGAP